MGIRTLFGMLVAALAVIGLLERYGLQQRARSIRALCHQERIAMHYISSCFAIALQCEQFFRIGADMRRTVDRM